VTRERERERERESWSLDDLPLLTVYVCVCVCVCVCRGVAVCVSGHGLIERERIVYRENTFYDACARCVCWCVYLKVLLAGTDAATGITCFFVYLFLYLSFGLSLCAYSLCMYCCCCHWQYASFFF
jgi:hypothetical protein